MYFLLIQSVEQIDNLEGSAVHADQGLKKPQTWLANYQDQVYTLGIFYSIFYKEANFVTSCLHSHQSPIKTGSALKGKNLLPCAHFSYKQYSSGTPGLQILYGIFCYKRDHDL